MTSDVFPHTPPQFKHAMSSCRRCYATLRFYHPTRSPDEITDALAITPTRSQLSGAPKRSGFYPVSAWFLSTKDKSDSKDIRAHIWGLILEIKDKRKLLRGLAANGWEADMYCFWESQSGNGGPYFDVSTLSALSFLELELGFDIWF